jgi:hypothetical protein
MAMIVVFRRRGWIGTGASREAPRHSRDPRASDARTARRPLAPARSEGEVVVREPVAQRRPDPTQRRSRVARVVREKTRAQVAHAGFAAPEHGAERHGLHLTQGVEGREAERRQHAFETALVEIVAVVGFTSTDGVVGTDAISTPPGRSIAASPARKRPGSSRVLDRLERDGRIEARRRETRRRPATQRDASPP